jgi:hypothetical protein
MIQTTNPFAISDLLRENLRQTHETGGLTRDRLIVRPKPLIFEPQQKTGMYICFKFNLSEHETLFFF